MRNQEAICDSPVLEGGTGSNLLVGGSGADEFRFDLGVEVGTVDIITDFIDSVDSLRFVNAGASPFTTIRIEDATLFSSSFSGAMVWTTDYALNDHFVYLEGVDETLLSINFDPSGDILIA